MKMQNMNQALQKNPSTDNNISKTGYRALFLLKKLMESPKSREELLECFEQDIVIKNDISKDTITNTINALKKAGCVISRPSFRTNNKYVLKSHPFSVCFSESNIDALLSLRESISTLGDWQLLINLNNFYAKISKLAPNQETQMRLLFEHPLKSVNYEILNKILINAKLKKHMIVCYDSPQNGEEELCFTPEFITLENKKLYIWGYNQKYDMFSYLRIDKIKKINFMNFLGVNNEAEDYEKPKTIAKYKLKGYSALMYQPEEDEKIIEENPDNEYPYTIETRVNNDFNFVQRLLSYGSDCVLLEPKELKVQLLESIKKIKEQYKND